MSLLTVRALGVTLAEPLFADLSFTLARGDRLGLIAANGRGKSTLLAMLAGQAAPTTGEITRARGARIGLVPQDPPAGLLALPLDQVVAGGLDDPDQDWRVAIALDDLAVPEDLRSRPLNALSGGWQRTALLARTLVGEPDVLLLDEPTNHLDLARVGLLERLLTGLPRQMAVILASHDRAFLDAVTTRSLFLRPERSRDFALPYSRALAALTEADEADERRFQNDLARVDQMRRQAARLKNIGINSGSDLLTVKHKQLNERADRLEAQARPAHQERSSGAIRLDPTGSHAKALVTLADAAVTAPDGRTLYRTGQLWVNPGDRIVVMGPNGAGKSRLLAAVAGALPGAAAPGTGGITVAPSARAGIADQEMTALAEDPTPFAAVTRRFDIGDTRARAALGAAGIDQARQGGPIAALSGGQRARLMMLILRLSRPNLYLLDEPTNHLDIPGQEALEAELQRPEAAALIVSHDRHFVRAVGTRFWLIQRARLVEVEGPDPWFAAMLAGAER
jgi:ATPase subunit of ABC transporter with duplicated ATPase domains